jgi:hypothetical protein
MKSTPAHAALLVTQARLAAWAQNHTNITKGIKETMAGLQEKKKT